MVAWMRVVRNGNSQESFQWAKFAGAGPEDSSWQVSPLACTLQRQSEGPGGLHVEAQTTGVPSR